MELINLFDTKKLIRYAIVFSGIVLLLKTVPSNTMDGKDLVVSALVMFALYVVVENIFTKASICGTENFSNKDGDEKFFSNTIEVPLNDNTKPAYDPNSSIKQTGSNTPTHTGKPGECKDCVRKTVDEYGMNTYMYKTNVQKYESGPTREKENVIVSEVQYTDYNILPVTPEDSKLYEYGYSFLPPEKWYPVPPHPPVCVTEHRCPVYPITTTGTPVDMKEWDSSRRITPGDVINIDYAKDKLNSGR